MEGSILSEGDHTRVQFMNGGEVAWQVHRTSLPEAYVGSMEGELDEGLT